MSKRICFIIPMYGKVPAYLNLFLKSVEYNDNYEFIFISDLELGCKLPENVKKYDCSKICLQDLIHKKTGAKPTFDNYYKIVDFKPAYGMIFQDYILDFDFWGLLDVDLILGQIDKFITSDLLDNYDIISARKYWLSGSFALFRNCEKINMLFQKSRDWEEIFSSKKLFRFCETGTIKNTNRTLLNLLRQGKPINEIDAQIVSFTHILNDSFLLNGIRVYFNDLIKESICKDMIIGYQKGRIFIYKSRSAEFKEDEEYLHYHFVSEKSKITFDYPAWNQVPEEYYITEYGFFTRSQLNKFPFLKHLRAIKNYTRFILILFPLKFFNKLRIYFRKNVIKKS